MTGVVYLLYFVTAIFGEVVVGRGRPVLYETFNLISHAFYIAVAQLFYYMFKPVNKSLSLLAAIRGLAGCADDVLNLFKPDPDRINSLGFLGPYWLLIGILILKSTFLPWVLGVAMALASLGWLVFLLPVASYFPLALRSSGFSRKDR